MLGAFAPSISFCYGTAMANALWITRMHEYSQSEYCTQTVHAIIQMKIRRQWALLKKYHVSPPPVPIMVKPTIQDILLHEARQAKTFWKHFTKLLPQWAAFPGRAPHKQDITNHLLDIGYHHITNKVAVLLEQHSVSPALGVLHVAQSATSKPLVYDLVELFRADLVDTEVLRFLRIKKKPVVVLTQKHIAQFLHALNARMNTKHYLHDFKQCHTYAYYMELQILKFIRAVNHRESFMPLHLPTRHDTRCS